MRRWYFFYPVGAHLLVVENLEEGLMIGSPMLSMGYKGDTVAVMADKQVPFEATIEIPPSIDEPLLYLFALHFSPLFATLVF
jgi:hypothetical protein